MITTARQLKDLVRNLSKKKIRRCTDFDAELYDGTFLERISLSEYKNQLY